ncbi:MAG: alpha/beta fold hydrolase [Thermoanaerobaculia bacterium]
MDLLSTGPDDAKHVVILAHGAGGAMDTQIMNRIAADLAVRAERVVRFEIPYMAELRTGGKRGAPDREPVLLDSWRGVVTEVGGRSPVIGGKSLGGRMASLVADELRVRGLICLGYPFHPPGAPEKLRTKHLATLRTPTLILQGERDPFGSREDVSHYDLASAILVEWLPDGDHSFRPRKGSGHTEAGNLSRATDTITSFLSKLD